MTEITLSKKAKQVIEGSRDQKADPFDFNTAPPQKPVKVGGLHGIEEMKFCLHSRPCPHLQAPGGQRPVCRVNGGPIFDFERCPKGLWFEERE